MYVLKKRRNADFKFVNLGFKNVSNKSFWQITLKERL
jgi:hypothetical protein